MTFSINSLCYSDCGIYNLPIWKRKLCCFSLAVCLNIAATIQVDDNVCVLSAIRRVRAKLVENTKMYVDDWYPPPFLLAST